jgi:hypothetical protein
MKNEIETEPQGMNVGPCGNCQRMIGNRRRTLCPACYAKPRIRFKFQPVRRFVGERVNIRSAPNGVAPYPTTARPGTDEKVRVLVWRVESGYELWHPEDARMDPELGVSECLLARCGHVVGERGECRNVRRNLLGDEFRGCYHDDHGS